jgi:hypothetical protein
VSEIALSITTPSAEEPYLDAKAPEAWTSTHYGAEGGEETTGCIRWKSYCGKLPGLTTTHRRLVSSEALVAIDCVSGVETLQATSLRRECLPTIPIELPPIAIDITVFVPQFSALVTCGSMITVVKIATQLTSIVGNFSLVAPDIATDASVPIPGKRRRHTHSDQQENSSNRTFHEFYPPTAIRGY